MFPLMKKTACVILAVALLAVSGCGQQETVIPSHGLDMTQAEAVLTYLEGIAQGRDVHGSIKPLAAMKGTKLLIGQMNLARRVSDDQYELILTGLIDRALPEIQPVDSSERALRGVEGLRNRVWGSLFWGIDHTNLLRERLDALEGVDLYGKAHSLALEFLPEPVDISTSLYVVMGGRAGAAAITGEGIYVDILIMTYSSVQRNRPFMTITEMTEFYAHEMHHLGLAEIHRRKYESLQLDDHERRLLSLLTSIVSEGAATYLINGHRQQESIRTTLDLPEGELSQDGIFRMSEDLIRNVADRRYQTDNEFERDNKLMTGRGYHTLGSLILGTIDRAAGLDAVMAVVDDPRLMLREYNSAADAIMTDDRSGTLFLYDSALADRAATIGK